MSRLIDILESYGIDTINESRRYEDTEEYIKEEDTERVLQNNFSRKIISGIINNKSTTPADQHFMANKSIQDLVFLHFFQKYQFYF